MLDPIKSALAVTAVRRFVLPIAIATLVTWLVANNYPQWADVVCSVSDALAIKVDACLVK